MKESIRSSGKMQNLPSLSFFWADFLAPLSRLFLSPPPSCASPMLSLLSMFWDRSLIQLLCILLISPTCNSAKLSQNYNSLWYAVVIYLKQFNALAIVICKRLHLDCICPRSEGRDIALFLNSCNDQVWFSGRLHWEPQCNYLLRQGVLVLIRSLCE